MELTIAMVQQKKIIINFSKTNTKYCLNLHSNGDENYFYVNKTKIYKFNAYDNSRFDSSVDNISNKTEDMLIFMNIQWLKVTENNFWVYLKNSYWVIN